VSNRAITATLMAVAVRTAVVNPLPTGGSVSPHPSRVAGPRGASWRLRSMEEGSVEFIVWAGGCAGARLRVEVRLIWNLMQDVHGPVGLGYRPPMGGRGGHFSGPVGVWCRVPGPVQRRHRTAGRCSLSRGAGLNNPPCSPVSCPNTPVKGDPM
jgi:hypothetical protein